MRLLILFFLWVTFPVWMTSCSSVNVVEKYASISDGSSISPENVRITLFSDFYDRFVNSGVDADQCYIIPETLKNKQIIFNCLSSIWEHSETYAKNQYFFRPLMKGNASVDATDFHRILDVSSENNINYEIYKHDDEDSYLIFYNYAKTYEARKLTRNDFADVLELISLMYLDKSNKVEYFNMKKYWLHITDSPRGGKYAEPFTLPR